MVVWALVPVCWVLLMTLLWRRPPFEAAWSGVVLAVLLWLGGAGAPFGMRAAGAALLDAGVLFAAVAAVMLPGLLLVELLSRTPANEALGRWVRTLGLQGHGQVVLIVLGIAPLLESMTGFGVSLVAVVPLLLSLFGRERALKMALAGMAVMPWGTLGLATVTGAALLAADARALSAWTALTSAPVFAVLALGAVWLAGFCSAAATAYTLGAAVLFVACLYGASHWVGAELAGVCAGGVLTLLHVLRRRVPWPRGAWPYALLFVLVAALKGLWSATGWDAVWVWQGVQAAWRPLGSPGAALLLLCLLLLARQERQGLWAAWGRRSLRPLLAVGGFLLMSQVMVKGGFLTGLQGALAGLDSTVQAVAAVLMGALGGYMTASNVGGNVLMLPALEGAPLLLAAMTNSAVGHAALGSLPMVAVLCGLAKADAAEERALVRFALFAVSVNMGLVLAAGCLLM